MSADLFTEFGTETEFKPPAVQPRTTGHMRPGIQEASSYAFFDGWSVTSARAPAPAPTASEPARASDSAVVGAGSGGILHRAPAAEEDDDVDDWGDFEGGPPSSPVAVTGVNRGNGPPSSPHDRRVSGLGRRGQLDPSSWQRALPVGKAKRAADPSVLFDVEDDVDEEEDEFGDFEGTEDITGAGKAATGTSSTLVDLLGGLEVPSSVALVASQSKSVSTPTRQPPELPSPAQRNWVSTLGTATRPPKTAELPAAKKVDDEAGWDAFDDWEQSIPGTNWPKKSQVATNNRDMPPSTTVVPIVSAALDDPRPLELPPTNVPPPGVLLSLFPSLFNDAQEKLFKPMAAQTLPMRDQIMAEPATTAYLAGYLVLANVAAHIIAGHNLRWKRDQHLSQGMRIGPASSRATSGMKLTGIDKGEKRKEEREVADVVRVWREQVGRLRHVVAGVNQIKAGALGAVPELQDAMPVKTLKQSEGGVPARQPCMLCGLKREERVMGADVSTDDSFGEWWIEQVNMHRGCRNFWNEHKDRLRQR